MIDRERTKRDRSRRNMKIISLDPGGTTGWAMLDIDMSSTISKAKAFLRDHVKQGQLGDSTEHHMLLWNFLISQAPDVIICERFKAYGNEFAKLMSIEYIGLVKLYRSLYNCKVVWHGSDKKEWANDRKLSILLLLCTPLVKWRHANDALRHLVYFLVFETPRELEPLHVFIMLKLRALQLAET